jgi:hypothetical protein
MPTTNFYSQHVLCETIARVFTACTGQEAAALLQHHCFTAAMTTTTTTKTIMTTATSTSTATTTMKTTIKCRYYQRYNNQLVVPFHEFFTSLLVSFRNTLRKVEKPISHTVLDNHVVALFQFRMVDCWLLEFIFDAFDDRFLVSSS